MNISEYLRATDARKARRMITIRTTAQHVCDAHRSMTEKKGKGGREGECSSSRFREELKEKKCHKLLMSPSVYSGAGAGSMADTHKS